MFTFAIADILDIELQMVSLNNCNNRYNGPCSAKMQLTIENHLVGLLVSSRQR